MTSLCLIHPVNLSSFMHEVIILLNKMKLFDLNGQFNYGNNILASNVDFNDQNWRSIDLPHDDCYSGCYSK
jgi:hypothetical protein